MNPAFSAILCLIKDAIKRNGLSKGNVRYVVGFSGGRDSVCLLHALSQVVDAESLRAVHVHHGLRKSADADAAFCEAFCRNLKVPLTICHVDAKAYAKEKGIGIEEAARILRYAAFSKETGEYDILALAHHEKDQAETVLMHLLRGSGMGGLCGMRELSVLTQPTLKVFRPLLAAPENLLDDYIRQNQLAYQTDETNLETAYLRNRIRLELLPYLQENYNPNVIRALSQTAALLQEEEAYMMEETRKAYDGCSGFDAEGNAYLSIPALKAAPAALQNRIIREYLQRQGLDKDLGAEHIRMAKDLMNGPTGRLISLPKGLTLARSYDILSVYQRSFSMEYSKEVCLLTDEKSRQIKADIKSFISGDDAYEKYLSADETQGIPVWRTWEKGDFLYVRKKAEPSLKEETKAGMENEQTALGRKSLQDLFTDLKIPRHMRHTIWLLCDGSHVLWACGLRVSEKAKLSNKTNRVLLARISPADDGCGG